MKTRRLVCLSISIWINIVWRISGHCRCSRSVPSWPSPSVSSHSRLICRDPCSSRHRCAREEDIDDAWRARKKRREHLRQREVGWRRNWIRFPSRRCNHIRRHLLCHSKLREPRRRIELQHEPSIRWHFQRQPWLRRLRYRHFEYEWSDCLILVERMTPEVRLEKVRE